LSEAAFENAASTLKEMGVEIQFSSQMTADAAMGWSSQLETVAIIGGEESANRINEMMNSLTDSLTPE
jgi:hypothetical protein